MEGTAGKGFKIHDGEKKCIGCGSTETTHIEYYDKHTEKRCEDCGMWFSRCLDCDEYTELLGVIRYCGFGGFLGRKMGNEVSKQVLIRIASENEGVEFDGDDLLITSGKRDRDGWFRDCLDLNATNCEESIGYTKCSHCNAESCEEPFWTGGLL